MSRIAQLIMTAFVLVASCRPAADEPTVGAALDAAMEQALRARRIPGAALVVVRDGEVIHSRGYGVADLTTGRPVTDSTPFVIGSTSKPLTALAVLRLVAEGRAALDTSIVRYLPDVEFTDARFARITLRHLLTNRSGMAVGFSGPAYDLPSVQDAAALDRLSRAAARMPLLFPPGEGYAYSNRGWSVAGYVAQRISGMPIEDFMKQAVFSPFGMDGTTLAFWTVPDLVQGYVEGRVVTNIPRPASLTREYGPSGMVVSTPRDVARLLRALLDHARSPGEEAVLPPELVAEMFRPQADAEGELGGPTRYGLGWEIDSTFGTLTIKKAGSVHTMVSLWVLLPERRTGLGLFFNREDYGVVPLVPSLLSILAGGVADTVATLTSAPYVIPAAVPVPVAARAAWTGLYDTRYGTVRAYLRGDSLFAMFEGGEVPLVAQSDSTFALADDVVSHGGRVFHFRPRHGRVTLWLDSDSLGVRIDP